MHFSPQPNGFGWCMFKEVVLLWLIHRLVLLPLFVCFCFFVFCVWSFFVVLSVISGFAINLMGKKELVALH